jgi:hypothetical protein
MGKVDLNFNASKFEDNNDKERRPSDIKGSVRIQKKNPVRRFFSNLIKNDIRTVAMGATDDVLLPDASQLLVSVLEYIIEGIFLDGDVNTFRRGSRSASGDIPYAAMFKSGKKALNSMRIAGSNNTALSYDEVIFDTLADAQSVLDDMHDYIDKYHKVSILDLYSFIKDVISNPEDVKDGSFADDNYGWRDLTGVRPKPIRGGGYILTLPKARYIK